ncbi:hypothetical protein [Paraferrimonas sp. SM1919]|uniref:hypothetical protein n=1 Tax=Paraferrimonas sp. SM1919 TaxID=2662263 RepID=UPI0013D0642E|nr:hypothetical protein [Paraferrimonas sp. SM1919]
MKFISSFVVAYLFFTNHAWAETAAEKMAKQLQDPLAYISAITIDNTVGLNQGLNQDQTGYDFQFQPVYSIQTDHGFSLVPRAVVPVLGQPNGGGTDWGIGDSSIQMFYAPSTDSDIKWGIGPQVSLKTRSDAQFAGAGWGGGLAGVIVGGNDIWSLSAIVNHMWGEDAFSMTAIQPIVYYNFKSSPGTFLAYDSVLTYDWKNQAGWTIPLGLSGGRMFDMGGGYGFELKVGGYKVVTSPKYGPEWQAKFAFSFVFPR